jgi:transcription antitermination factor NusG
MNGISRIVFTNGSPAIIKQKEIDAIKVFVQNARGRECHFGVDDEVIVACGPLKNISGKIKKAGSDHVILHLEQIGMTVSIRTNQILKKKI